MAELLRMLLKSDDSEVSDSGKPKDQCNTEAVSNLSGDSEKEVEEEK